MKGRPLESKWKTNLSLDYTLWIQGSQQQHYNRLANSHNNAASSMAVSAAAHVQDSGLENVSEDNRRTLSYIADLLRENTREAALLELSKKREQVPELALILWHSFGMSRPLHPE